jgi:DNA-binding GntR family transcriptional regulator
VTGPKGLYTVAEVAALFDISRRQAYRKLVRDGLIQPKGRRVTHRVTLTRLLAVYGDELDSIALAQRLAG